MPAPVLFAYGIWHLNIRVPSDLAIALRGTVVTLPVADETATVLRAKANAGAVVKNA